MATLKNPRRTSILFDDDDHSLIEKLKKRLKLDMAEIVRMAIRRLADAENLKY